MKRKFLGTLLAVTCAATLLSACGNGSSVQESSTEDTETSTDEVTSTEDVSTEVSVEEPIVEEEEPTPYIEEQGIVTTTETQFNLPFALKFYDADACAGSDPVFEDFEGLKADTSCNLNLVITGVSETESADDPEYKDIVITYQAEGSPIIKYSDYLYWPENWQFRFSLPSISLCDYYTGIIFPGNSISDTQGIDITTDVEWEGQTYTVSYVEDASDASQGYYGGELDFEDKWYGCYYGLGYTSTVTVHVPKDYDGLCAYLFKSGTTEIGGIDEPDLENRYYICQPDEEGVTHSADDYIIIRVSDLINQ